MNTHARDLSGQYAIRVEDIAGPVTATIDGLPVARTTRARIMYETRLTPTIYFPVADVCATLSAPTDLQTFCPFKGTARYFDITIGDGTLPNAAWAYDVPLPESRCIAGHVGFMPGTGIEIGTTTPVPPPADDGNISGPLVDWLLRVAASCPTPADLTARLAEKLLENGVALSRMSVMIWSLHPQIAGRNYIWTKATGKIDTFAPSYEIYDHPGFINSPLRHVSQGLGGVRQKIGAETDDTSFPIIQDLRAAGATDYVAMPLPFSDGQINVLTLSSDHPDGFTTANLGLIFECSGAIGRYYEVFNQRENARSLLETYVGTRAGARVLGGEIRRGDGDEIDAAIMFCDLRASTRLEEQLGRADFLDVLNRFFETASARVEEHGGEVLKFIGDAVLAVFPAGDDPALARQQALDAARAIVADLEELSMSGETCRCAIGIAYGGVTYGNIGSRARLDFTVIGQAANIAARLGEYGKTCGRHIIVTADIARDATDTVPLGPVHLHNVAEPVDAFAAG